MQLSVAKANVAQYASYYADLMQINYIELCTEMRIQLYSSFPHRRAPRLVFLFLDARSIVVKLCVPTNRIYKITVCSAAHRILYKVAYGDIAYRVTCTFA